MGFVDPYTIQKDFDNLFRFTKNSRYVNQEHARTVRASCNPGIQRGVASNQLTHDLAFVRPVTAGFIPVER